MISNNIEDLLYIYQNDMYTTSAPQASYQLIFGHKEAKVLVLVHEDERSADQLAFIQKMLAACKLQSEDYNVVGTSLTNFDPVLLKEFQPETLILFGLYWQNESFHIQKKLNQPFRFHQQKWLLAPALTEIMKDDKVKSELWINGLKPLFNI